MIQLTIFHMALGTISLRIQEMGPRELPVRPVILCIAKSQQMIGFPAQRGSARMQLADTAVQAIYGKVEDQPLQIHRPR